MKIKNVFKIPLDGPLLIEYERFNDNRGSFSEIWGDELNKILERDAYKYEFVQMNETTCVPNSIRGLHFQYNPYVGKLIRILMGTVYDYIVDIRLGSPTLGKAFMIALDNDNKWFWVPPGFAHCVFSKVNSRFQYFCSGKYNKDCEGSIYPFSDDIDYSLCDKNILDSFNKIKISPVISAKDSKINSLKLREWLKDARSSNFVYGDC